MYFVYIIVIQHVSPCILFDLLIDNKLSNIYINNTYFVVLQLYIVIDVHMKDDCKMQVRCVKNERAQIYLKAEFLKSVLGHKMPVGSLLQWPGYHT